MLQEHVDFQLHVVFPCCQWNEAYHKNEQLCIEISKSIIAASGAAFFPDCKRHSINGALTNNMSDWSVVSIRIFDCSPKW